MIARVKWIEQPGDCYRLDTPHAGTYLLVEKFSDGIVEGGIRYPGSVSLVSEYSTVSGAKSATRREAERRGLFGTDKHTPKFIPCVDCPYPKKCQGSCSWEVSAPKPAPTSHTPTQRLEAGGTFSTHDHPTRYWQTWVTRDGIGIAMANGLTREEAEANAERIRLCCNSHEALVAALEAALPKLAHSVECIRTLPSEEWEKSGSISFDRCECVVAKVTAALALAKGEA